MVEAAAAVWLSAFFSLLVLICLTASVPTECDPDKTAIYSDSAVSVFPLKLTKHKTDVKTRSHDSSQQQQQQLEVRRAGVGVLVSWATGVKGAELSLEVRL